jgi:hypothetical protein
MAVLLAAVAVIGCKDDGGTGGSGGTAGNGGGGSGGAAEGCADAGVVCADCEADTPEWERCQGAVVVCNFLEPSECQACIESSEPARDCDGAGGTGGTGGTAGGGGMGGTPAEGCADSNDLCANCEVDTPEWEVCLGGVFLCNEFVEPMECPACIELLQPGGGTGGTAGTGGSGGSGGFPPTEAVCVLCGPNDLLQEQCAFAYEACVANPPSGNALEKCVVLGLAACKEPQPG